MLTIVGPTASGKTSTAVAVALRLNAEILSGDSRQVYRRMDIGTGKDLCDYDAGGGKKVGYHLIDICEPGSKYNIYEYQRDFLKAYNGIVGRGRLPLLCGGSGLYIEAVLRGYRLSPVPESKELRARLAGKSLAELTDILVELKRKHGARLHNTTDVETEKRAIRAIEIETFSDKMGGEGKGGYLFPKIESLIVGMKIGRDERRRRITQRLRQRFANGMIDEVKGLLDSGIAAEDLMYYGLEYKYVTEHVIGKIGFDEMFSALETAIHQFAKRQMTWFRGMERRGLVIHWIDATMSMAERVDQIVNLYGQYAATTHQVTSI